MKSSAMRHFHVPGMTCGGCLKAVTRAIQKLDSQAAVEGNLENRTITVNSQKPEALLLVALENAGYPAKHIPAES
jgi:copper chaperone